MPHIQPIEFWSLKKVLEVTATKRSSLWAWVKERKFPAPVRLHDGGRRVAWVSTEVQKWMKERMARRILRQRTRSVRLPSKTSKQIVEFFNLVAKLKKELRNERQRNA